MATNKVVYGSETLIDLSGDTLTSGDQLLAGVVAHARDGSTITGTASPVQRLKFENVSVAASKFVSNTTYSDFPYRAAVTLSGVLSTDDPEVTFGVEDAISGNYAPVAATYNGGIYIYAAEIPSAAFTIPRIICWRDIG